MTESLLIGLGAVAILGVSAQWMAWRFRVPSILLLLTFGFLAGPITGFLNPDALFGDTLFPIVALAVGIILFEGGLNLEFEDLGSIESVVFRLLTLGALATWAVGAAAAHFIVGISWQLSILLGAILIVTGPTVVGPILRQVRPKGKVANLLQWEGILIDPIGAVLAVLVLEIIIHADGVFTLSGISQEMFIGIIRTVLIGGGAGAVGGGVLILILRRYWVPDYLQNSVALMIVAGTFVSADILQHESGLLATTVMGLVMANQTLVSVNHITEFAEDIQSLLLGGLFILLSARVGLDGIIAVGWEGLLFLAALILIGRPLAIATATLWSPLSWEEGVFAAWIAPRGIVAAAVASIFADELSHAGFADAAQIVPLTFMVIVGTVLFYGLTIGPVARYLGLSEQNPQGVLIIGGHKFARMVAGALQEQGFRALIVDSNRRHIQQGRLQGLETHYGNALSEKTLKHLDLSRIGRMLALTGNNEVNSLAALHYREIFGRAEVYQLGTHSHTQSLDESAQNLQGRRLFQQDLTYASFEEMIEAGAQIKTTKLTKEFNYDEFRLQYGETSVPLFLVDEKENLHILNNEINLNPEPGHTVLSISVKNAEEEEMMEMRQEQQADDMGLEA